MVCATWSLTIFGARYMMMRIQITRGSTMTNRFRIVYAYRFSNGSTKIFDILLDKRTLALITERREDLPEWARLEFNQCAICPLDKTTAPYCPIAVNLSEIAEAFKYCSSLDRVDVSVTVEERTYVKAATVPHGLSPLMGIIMTTSGCPVMEPLKPMVRYHLPFASLEETVFRMVSMYLVGQFLRNHEGKTAEWSVEGLTRIYADVEKVNKGFVQRMYSAAKNDGNVNALVNLDIFAIMVPRVAEDMLQQLRPYFTAHLT